MKFKIIIFIIVIISAYLRIYNIEQKNLWFDEIYSWNISQGNIVEIVTETSGDIHPPFYYILLKFWNNIFSDSIFSMRMLSVLFGILSMYFIYKISKLFLKDNLQVCLVLLLYAFSPLNIYYSQEVRMLNLNLFLCLGSVYFFFRFLDTSRNIFALLYLFFTVLGLYTHYFAFLILFSQLCVVIIFYSGKKISFQTLKNYTIYLIGINLLYIPWYPVFFEQTNKGQPWRTEQTFTETGNNIAEYFKNIFLSPYFNFENNGINYFSNLLILFIFALMIFSLFKIFNSKTFFKDTTNSIIYFFFIPLIIAITISINKSIVLSRYLSILIPYFFIMLVYLSFKIYKIRTAVIICLFLILASVYGTNINFNNNFKNNDYRRIISYLEENFKQGDEIIVEPHFMGWGINYYLNHSNSDLSVPKILGWNLGLQIDSLKNSKDITKVWFVLDYSSLGKNKYDSLSYLMSEIGYDKIKSKSFYVIPEKVKVEYYRRSDL
ncbi:MAG: glycosyltransferase family 39 protein [Bacteroidota bacterium]|nr:glycosyltransferase family 39 protein [Bacteroidota bacterium]